MECSGRTGEHPAGEMGNGGVVSVTSSRRRQSLNKWGGRGRFLFEIFININTAS